MAGQWTARAVEWEEQVRRVQAMPWDSFEARWWDRVPDRPDLRFFKDIARQGVWVTQFFPCELPEEEGEFEQMLREKLNALGDTLMLAWREWKERDAGR